MTTSAEAVLPKLQLNTAEKRILKLILGWIKLGGQLRKEGYCRTKEGKLVSPLTADAHYFSMDALLEKFLFHNWTGDSGQNLHSSLSKILKPLYGYYSVHEAGWKLSPKDWINVLETTLAQASLN